MDQRVAHERGDAAAAQERGERGVAAAERPEMAPAGTDPPVPRVRSSATETKTTSSGPEVDPDLQK